VEGACEFIEKNCTALRPPALVGDLCIVDHCDADTAVCYYTRDYTCCEVGNTAHCHNPGGACTEVFCNVTGGVPGVCDTNTTIDPCCETDAQCHGGDLCSLAYCNHVTDVCDGLGLTRTCPETFDLCTDPVCDSDTGVCGVELSPHQPKCPRACCYGGTLCADVDFFDCTNATGIYNGTWMENNTCADGVCATAEPTPAPTLATPAPTLATPAPTVAPGPAPTISGFTGSCCVACPVGFFSAITFCAQPAANQAECNSIATTAGGQLGVTCTPASHTTASCGDEGDQGGSCAITFTRTGGGGCCYATPGATGTTCFEGTDGSLCPPQYDSAGFCCQDGTCQISLAACTMSAVSFGGGEGLDAETTALATTTTVAQTEGAATAPASTTVPATTTTTVAQTEGAATAPAPTTALVPVDPEWADYAKTLCRVLNTCGDGDESLCTSPETMDPELLAHCQELGCCEVEGVPSKR